MGFTESFMLRPMSGVATRALMRARLKGTRLFDVLNSDADFHEATELYAALGGNASRVDAAVEAWNLHRQQMPVRAASAHACGSEAEAAELKLCATAVMIAEMRRLDAEAKREQKMADHEAAIAAVDEPVAMPALPPEPPPLTHQPSSGAQPCGAASNITPGEPGQTPQEFPNQPPRLSSSSSNQSFEAAAAASSASQQHMMLSYCWDDKPRVLLFCQAMRARGIDVWRDEDGSKILGRMEGDVSARMAEAVERSHTVVCFVSRKYRDSESMRPSPIETCACILK